jgi:eukaryotic-like serine/threonine-protein kinase
MRAPPGKSCPSCGERYDLDVLFCPRDGTPLQTSKNQPSTRDLSAGNDPYLGVELQGQIRLKHLIGIGSMGRVYRAWQGGIDRDVAVKILHRELSGNGELVKRFHREAKVASRLVHPNVVQVLMTGTVPFVPDPHVGGEMYLVMEYLDGISLLSALAAAGTAGEGQALPLPRALHVALQICDAVGEAHAQQIVHRDLKPENVMLVRRGEDRDFVKVLDFGIARLDWGEKGMETQAGMIFGTAKYISPEGAEGHPVTPPGDVYAIATMLYQMLAGRTPFEGDSSVALLVQHAHAPPTDLREIARASYVPAPLAEVIMRNLAKKATDRAPTARHLGRELVAAARASGLFPEELTTKNTLLSEGSFGAVKLVSKERTKALELGVELAAKIGGIAARPSATPTPAPVAGAYGPTNTELADPTEEALRLPELLPNAPRAPSSQRLRSAPPPLPVVEAQSVNGRGDGSASRSVDVSFSRPSRTSSGGRASRTSSPNAELDFDDVGALAEGPLSSDRSPGPHPTVSMEPVSPPVVESSLTPTIQGTEQSLKPAPVLPPKPRRPTPWVAIIAGIAFIVPMAVVGVRRLASGPTQTADSIESSLDEVRSSMRSHEWTTPPGHNVKELLGDAKSKWPLDGRVRDLVRDAGEKLVTEAINRKYAHDVPEAVRLSHLALEIDPENTTAQHLVQELEGDGPNADASDAPATASTPDRPAPPRPVPRVGKVAAPPATAKTLAPPTNAKPAPPPGPSAAVLPPKPGPPTGDKPPTPAGTGPWL